MNKSKGILTQVIMNTLLACVLAAPAQAAATPTPRINYQGVLRDASGAPLNGAHEMTFRFFSLDTSGDEILTDTRAFMTPAGPVIVTNGLFNATLGDGVIADGSGPGTYADLAQVFRDYAVVWLEVQIGAEVLAPRVRVTASAYALNASNLEGKPASSFLDTGSADQSKTGTIGVFSNSLNFAVTASSRGGGVRAYDSLGGAGLSEVGTRDFGIRSYGRRSGNGMPGWFKDTQDSGEAWIAPGNDGLIAFGSNAGGIFRRGTPASYSDQALLASGGYGISARGDGAGGYFVNNFGYGTASIATGVDGIDADGYQAGGRFNAVGGHGVIGEGYLGGGAFSGYYTGVDATGVFSAGEFNNSDGIATVELASQWGIGSGIGVVARGNTMGAWITDLTYSTEVLLAWGDTGIWAEGATQGGYFTSAGSGTSNFAHLANGWGVMGSGSYGFGFGGGTFRDAYYSGLAQLGRADAGIVAYGSAIPGIFRQGSEAGWSTWTHIAEGSSSINGNGAKNFVQNHPYDPDSEIVYSALEGDEVGTYTRGSALFEDGVARVKLSASFAWVTNPDFGLTATVTPRGAPLAVGVESVSTTELIVRADGGADGVAFDYVVQGLRAGFESASVVRPKRGDAPIPSMAEHAEVYAAHPELQQYTARERFAAMSDPAGGAKPLDLSRSDALIAAIGVGDSSRAPVVRHSLLTSEHAAQWEQDHPGMSLSQMEARPSPESGPIAPPRLERSERPGRQYDIPMAETGRVGTGGDRRTAPGAPGTQPLPAPAANRLPIADAVEPGDVLVNDWARPGTIVRAREAGDRGVIGIVIGDPGTRYLTEAPVALAGMVVLCKVDATEFPIAANDLLMASSLAGHAMRAGENPRQGSVIGKALEPLDAGTGVIRVLVMSR